MTKLSKRKFTWLQRYFTRKLSDSILLSSQIAIAGYKFSHLIICVRLTEGMPKHLKVEKSPLSHSTPLEAVTHQLQPTLPGFMMQR